MSDDRRRAAGLPAVPGGAAAVPGGAPAVPGGAPAVPGGAPAVPGGTAPALGQPPGAIGGPQVAPGGLPGAIGGPQAAPGLLRWMEELVNTRSIEAGSDEIATPDRLASWLRDCLLLPPGVPVTAQEHDRAVQIREGLRELMAANNASRTAADNARGGRRPRRGPGGLALANLARLARRLPLVLDLDGSQPRLMPLSRGTADTVLASLLGAVAEAVASGTWDRLKICQNPDCRWAYYDHSRNRSRAWCSMTACGNRAKARAFRARSR